MPSKKKPQGGWSAKGNQVMLNDMIYWLNTGDTVAGFASALRSVAECVWTTLSMVWEKVFNALIGVGHRE